MPLKEGSPTGRQLWRTAAIIALGLLLSRMMYVYLLFGIRVPHLGHLMGTPHTIPDTVITVSIVKGSTRYVPGWVKHHVSLGVARMIIFDDNGDSSPLPGALREFVDAGTVELIRAPRYNVSTKNRQVLGVPLNVFIFDKQQTVYLDTWRRLWRTAPPNTWLGQIDVDEYYNTRGRPLPDILASVRRKRGAQSVRIHKLEYGVSGQLAPTLDVLGKFVMRDNETVTEAKHSGLSLVSAITGMAGGCTHIFETNSLLMNVVRGRHECNNFRRSDMGKVVNGVWYAPSMQININHYVTLSLDECLASSSKVHIDGSTHSKPCFATVNTTDRDSHPAGRFTVCDDSAKPGRCAALGCAAGAGAFDGSCPLYRPLLRVRTSRECHRVGGDRATYARCGNQTYCCGACHGERRPPPCRGTPYGAVPLREDCACPSLTPAAANASATGKPL